MCVSSKVLMCMEITPPVKSYGDCLEKKWNNVVLDTYGEVSMVEGYQGGKALFLGPTYTATKHRLVKNIEPQTKVVVGFFMQPKLIYSCPVMQQLFF